MSIAETAIAATPIAAGNSLQSSGSGGPGKRLVKPLQDRTLAPEPR